MVWCEMVEEDESFCWTNYDVLYKVTDLYSDYGQGYLIKQFDNVESQEDSPSNIPGSVAVVEEDRSFSWTCGDVQYKVTYLYSDYGQGCLIERIYNVDSKEQSSSIPAKVGKVEKDRGFGRTNYDDQYKITDLYSNDYQEGLINHADNIESEEESSSIDGRVDAVEENKNLSRTNEYVQYKAADLYSDNEHECGIEQIDKNEITEESTSVAGKDESIEKCRTFTRTQNDVHETVTDKYSDDEQDCFAKRINEKESGQEPSSIGGNSEVFKERGTFSLTHNGANDTVTDKFSDDEQDRSVQQIDKNESEHKPSSKAGRDEVIVNYGTITWTQDDTHYTVTHNEQDCFANWIDKNESQQTPLNIPCRDKAIKDCTPLKRTCDSVHDKVRNMISDDEQKCFVGWTDKDERKEESHLIETKDLIVYENETPQSEEEIIHKEPLQKVSNVEQAVQENPSEHISSPNGRTGEIPISKVEPLLHRFSVGNSHSLARIASIASAYGNAWSFMFACLFEFGSHRKVINKTFFKLLPLMLLNPAYGQHCSWKPSTKTTFHGVVGESAQFSFVSLAPSWDGNLFTWQLDGSTLAAFEYMSGAIPPYVVDEIPSTRVIANSTYVNNTMSQHSLTITSLIASDNGKRVSFRREGCSLSTEKAEPINLFVSCCDHFVFENDATAVGYGSSINCNDKVVFICNEDTYQALNFTAVCQANSDWDIKEHPCVPYCDSTIFGLDAWTAKSNIKYKDEVFFNCNEMIYKTKTFAAKCQANATWNITQHTCAPMDNKLEGAFTALIIIVCFLFAANLVLVAMLINVLNKMNEWNEENGTDSEQTLLRSCLQSFNFHLYTKGERGKIENPVTAEPALTIPLRDN